MRRTALSILFCFIAAVNISAQTTEFTYQGSFKDGAVAANGSYDFEFKLFNLVSGGAQQGSTVQRLNVAVVNGSFVVSLDFGAVALSGADRFLDIALRTAGGGAFTPLSPRQKLTSAPYSVRSLNSATADTATNATQLGGVAAGQYVVTTDPRMTNERAPTAGSGNYIQNQDAAPQVSSNFNISGTGTANFVNAATQFNLNSNRILSAPANNLFVGLQTGQSNSTGDSNSFFGRSAGANNTIGGNNSFFGFLAGNTTNTGNGNAFFGYSAGRSNTTGGVNSFFGFNAGEFSTTANYNSFFGFNAGNKTTAEGNSFFGASAGENNTTGTNNSFFGLVSGQSNTTGSSNSFFGRGAGLSNTTGNGNSFIGVNAGLLNTEGFGNSFVGSGAGQVNTTGSYNTFVGDSAGFSNTTAGSHVFVGVNAGRSNTTGGSNAFVGKDAGFANTTGGENAFFGAASGQSNTTGGNNTFVGATAGLLNTTGADNSYVGHAAGYSNTTGIQNSFFGSNAGSANTANYNSFFGVSTGQANTTGTANSFFGRAAGVNNSVGGENSFFGESAGFVNTAGTRNSFFGRDAGLFNTGSNNSFFGRNAGSANSSGTLNTAIGDSANFGSPNLTHATAIGADSTVSTSNTIALGRSSGADQVVIPGNLVANLPAGDIDYIQNRTSPQAANFSISGNGLVGGNLGVGTTNPQAKLDVNGDVTATGNMSQGNTASGLLKFGLLINADGSINICVNPAAPSNCGVSVSHPATGYYDITFPYQINSRIFNATTALRPDFQLENIDVIMLRPTGTNTVRVRVASFGANSFDVNVAFYLTVF